MPYTYEKNNSGNYVVYKKNPDGSRGKEVGETGSTKEELKKYLGALYANESTKKIVAKTIKELKEKGFLNEKEFQKYITKKSKLKESSFNDEMDQQEKEFLNSLNNVLDVAKQMRREGETASPTFSIDVANKLKAIYGALFGKSNGDETFK